MEAAAACGGGGEARRGGLGRDKRGIGRGGVGRVYAKPTVESGVVSTACAGFLLRAHARREHLGLLRLCVVLGGYTSVGMGVMIL
jgi:hypothetical protein